MHALADFLASLPITYSSVVSSSASFKLGNFSLPGFFSGFSYLGVISTGGHVNNIYNKITTNRHLEGPETQQQQLKN